MKNVTNKKKKHLLYILIEESMKFFFIGDIFHILVIKMHYSVIWVFTGILMVIYWYFPSFLITLMNIFHHFHQC